uniref:NADH dehydrogenase subunit 4L n=1 Tax=Mierspenaeopsis hardwickii TaxID=2715607 RepID=A0A172W6K1_9EUCA|nr:NADH dehydrogenase subunit 4L [Mierspenaeopsis hardwickii]
MLVLGLYYMVPLVSVVCGLWVFVYKRKHLLNTLLSLEYIMLSIFWFMSLNLSGLGHESYFLLFFFNINCLWSGLSISFIGVCGPDTWKWLF